MPNDTRVLFEKIQALPAERLAEVENLVNFIASRTEDGALTTAASAAGASSFAAARNDRDDDAYGAL